MHSAEKQGNECAGPSFPTVKNLVGIGRGKAVGGFVLDRNLGPLGHFDQALDNDC